MHDQSCVKNEIFANHPGNIVYTCCGGIFRQEKHIKTYQKYFSVLCSAVTFQAVQFFVVNDTPLTSTSACRWGKFVELFILDCRQYRSLPTDNDTLANPKTMLGEEQVIFILLHHFDIIHAYVCGFNRSVSNKIHHYFVVKLSFLPLPHPYNASV